ncbi:hypothetical protein PGSY75_1315000 [Plasmodium gaboni]|uniref:Uncharacterized protein n=1 Tax=Plasmodium gaboni TaxID=647221 RepID=A0A151LDD8_9APIC|nr:hypothetical protein PGSY75_1315000 [Plasmodium gaboni]KYN96951.1 hypothetical protein PGSY75_1315000 [Plasmodium gaboni]SOV17330.1 conserved Plasmodium protein, unknown function [Plasmodium gaboni]SOV24204.1 conserved Plasmodium protein, unknown function [Plasmodium sp. DRC-Itaito]
MAGTLNLNDLKDEAILYYENALSYVFSNSSDENKKEIPLCVIYPNETIKVGFPIYSIKNINKNENVMNEDDNNNNRFNEEPLITYASESKYLYPKKVRLFYGLLYLLIFLEIFVTLYFKDNINYITSGEINLGQRVIYTLMCLSHFLVIMSKFKKCKSYLFDIYTSLSLFFFILSVLTINCFSSAFISIIQFFIFYLHLKINFYVMPQSCVIPP